MMRGRMWRESGQAIAAAALGLLIVAGIWVYGLRLRPTTTVSGWLLGATIAALASFGARKKMRAIPLGRTSSWLQIHIDVGLVSIALFISHAWYTPDGGLHVPGGGLETTLAAAYIATAASGVVGLVLSRTVPSRLTAAGNEVIYERLPIYRRDLRERAEAVVLQASVETGATTLADFYLRRLADFFSQPRHFWAHVAQSRRPRALIIGELDSLHRYLGDREKSLSQQLAHLVKKKDEADHAQAMQGLLKGWLAFHVAVTSALLVLVIVHIFVVYWYGAA